MNSVGQNHVLFAASPTPFSITVRLSVVEPCRFPCNPHSGRSDPALPQSTPQCWEGLVVPPGSLFPLEEQRLSGDLPEWRCAGPRRGSAVEV